MGLDTGCPRSGAGDANLKRMVQIMWACALQRPTLLNGHVSTHADAMRCAGGEQGFEAEVPDASAQRPSGRHTLRPVLSILCHLHGVRGGAQCECVRVRKRVFKCGHLHADGRRTQLQRRARQSEAGSHGCCHGLQEGQRRARASRTTPKEQNQGGDCFGAA